jgi:hypothetical protein
LYAAAFSIGEAAKGWASDKKKPGLKLAVWGLMLLFLTAQAIINLMTIGNLIGA